MATKKESTHQLIHRNLTLYQREHSAVWQCRYKVDNKWIRATTKETQLDLAVNKAKELLVEAEIRKRSGIALQYARIITMPFLWAAMAPPRRWPIQLASYVAMPLHLLMAKSLL